MAGVLVLAAAVVIVIALWSQSGGSDESSVPVQAAPALVAPGLTISRTDNFYTAHTVYIAGSEEQAATVLAGINDANVIRDSMGLPPLLDEVAVATSGDEAASIQAAESDLNRILVALFQVENRVVDLRQ
jgi:hypothetical protein